METNGTRLAASQLDEHAKVIRERAERSITDILEIGRRLSEVKRALGRTDFLVWVAAQFRWSEDTAERLISIYALQGRIPEIAEVSIPITGLYLIAAPSTPAAAARAIVAKAQNEHLSVGEIRTTVESFRSVRKPEPMMSVPEAEAAFARAQQARKRLPSYIPSAPPSAPEPGQHTRTLDLAKVEHVVALFQQLTEPEKGQCVHRLRRLCPAAWSEPDSPAADCEVVF
jgi:Protein of unknown function (DUF3102)